MTDLFAIAVQFPERARIILRDAMREKSWNVTKAARALGVCRNTFKRIADMLGIRGELYDQTYAWAARFGGKSRSKNVRSTSHLKPMAYEYLLVRQGGNGYPISRQLIRNRADPQIAQREISSAWRRSGGQATVAARLLGMEESKFLVRVRESGLAFGPGREEP
jgi:transcriptional regulator with GAF, ATPase, and Fis domain